MLKTVENKVIEVQSTLDVAIRELQDVLDTEDIENKDQWTRSAIKMIELAKEELEED
jgi:hypothetical protein